MNLDGDLVAALDKVGWNADAVQAAESAQDYRDNPPTRLTLEESMNAVWEANRVLHSQWRDPYNNKMHVRFDQDGKHAEFTLEYTDLVFLGKHEFIELHGSKCREAITTLTGDFILPDFEALRREKQHRLGDKT